MMNSKNISELFIFNIGVTMKNYLYFLIALVIFFTAPFILAIFKNIGIYPEFIEQLPGTKDLVDDIALSLAFLSSLAAIAIACIAWSQIRPIKKTMKMDFIRHLDEQWITPNITRVRSELWALYWEEVLKTGSEKAALKKVQQYVRDLHRNAKKNPQGENGSTKEINIEKLFRYLNFIDLMGTINIYKQNSVLDIKEIETLYAGRLKQYLRFYDMYFEEISYENKKTPNAHNAKRLLDDLKEKQC